MPKYYSTNISNIILSHSESNIGENTILNSLIIQTEEQSKLKEKISSKKIQRAWRKYKKKTNISNPKSKIEAEDNLKCEKNFETIVVNNNNIENKENESNYSNNVQDLIPEKNFNNEKPKAMFNLNRMNEERKSLGSENGNQALKNSEFRRPVAKLDNQSLLDGSQQI